MHIDDSENWRISVCGLNCVKCDIYQAGHGDDKLRDEIVEWFREERNETVRPEQVRCEGCRGPVDVHWSPDCKILVCARRKGFQYCFQCPNFLWPILEEFASDGVANHARTVENLKKMKRIGVNAWTEEQEKKGEHVFCP